MNEKEILERFYNIWFRAPTKKEFVACGGDINYVIGEYGEYTYMLEEHGYLNKHSGNTTIEAVHDDGRVFTGLADEVAEELNCSIQAIRYALCVNKTPKRNGWTLRVLPFDVETFNSYKE